MAKKMYELLYSIVDEIGVDSIVDETGKEHIIQTVTNDAFNLVTVRRMLIKKKIKLF